MKHAATILVLATLLSCSSDPAEPREPNPSKPGTEQEPDYTAALADKTVRAELPSMTLAFGTPGVMYVVSDGKASFIDLDNGVRIDFSASPAMIAVDGNPLNVESCKTIRTEGGLSWHVATVSHNGASGEAVIVTESLQALR